MLILWSVRLLLFLHISGYCRSEDAPAPHPLLPLLIKNLEYVLDMYDHTVFLEDHEVPSSQSTTRTPETATPPDHVAKVGRVNMEALEDKVKTSTQQAHKVRRLLSAASTREEGGRAFEAFYRESLGLPTELNTTTSSPIVANAGHWVRQVEEILQIKAGGGITQLSAQMAKEIQDECTNVIGNMVKAGLFPPSPVGWEAGEAQQRLGAWPRVDRMALDRLLNLFKKAFKLGSSSPEEALRVLELEVPSHIAEEGDALAPFLPVLLFRYEMLKPRLEDLNKGEGTLTRVGEESKGIEKQLGSLGAAWADYTLAKEGAIEEYRRYYDLAALQVAASAAQAAEGEAQVQRERHEL